MTTDEIFWEEYHLIGGEIGTGSNLIATVGASDVQPNLTHAHLNVTRSELAGNLAGGVTGADVHVGDAFPSQARLAFDGVRTGQLFLGANLDPAASALANLTFEWPAGEIPVTSQASATPPRP